MQSLLLLCAAFAATLPCLAEEKKPESTPAHLQKSGETAAAATPGQTAPVPAPVLVPVSLYDKDPGHLWNRVYSALMVRGPGATPEENDLLDPPFYFQTSHLLKGDSHPTGVALLNELAQGPLRPDKMSALQRAVMQRDLLGIFQWAIKQEWTPEQRTLSTALARGMRAVALTADEIRKLPDNYTAAVTAPEAVTSFDEAKPGPFLPKDLLADDGPWLALISQNDQRVVASVHMEFFNWRSSFEVRLRHPGGRAAGEVYLKELAAASGKPPQFPPGTMWALVRRAVLADSKGEPVVSPLVESVQVRVYRNLKLQALEAQTYFEWETRHALLLEKKGFHLTTARDQFYSHFPHTEDPFAGARRHETELNCFQCHNGEGIASVAHQTHLFGSNLPAAALYAEKRDTLDRIISDRASGTNGWTLLRWLWNEPAR